MIANVDSISAPELVYPEAVYLHNGESYFVRELDLVGKVAYVERHEMDYYTQAVLESSVKIKDERRQRGGVPGSLLAFGEVDVTWQTVAFKKIKFGTRENIGLGPVDIPAQTLPTTAVWLAPDDTLRKQMKAAGHRTSEGMTGLRNLAMVALPMVAMCDSRDLGGVVDSKNLGRSTMILYDRYPRRPGLLREGLCALGAGAGDLPANGRRVSMRRGLPELCRPAEPTAGNSQRPGFIARVPDAEQGCDDCVVGDVVA